MAVHLNELYPILRKLAVKGKLESYSGLSRRYADELGIWIEPHGGWDTPLGALNRKLAAAGMPALSAVITYAPTITGNYGPPGEAFWGCASNVPEYPSTAAARESEWLRILKEVHAYPWPEDLP